MAKYSYMLLVSPKPGREAEWNDWHQNRHVPDILDVPGFVSCRRFKAAPQQRNNGTPQWAYLAFYEMETEDPATVFADVARRIADGHMAMSNSWEASSAVTILWEPVSEHPPATRARQEPRNEQSMPGSNR